MQRCCLLCVLALATAEEPLRSISDHDPIWDLDVNLDGRISAGELKARLQLVHRKTEESRRAALAALRIDKIEFSEQQLYEIATEPEGMNMAEFMQADRDRDGAATEAEAAEEMFANFSDATTFARARFAAADADGDHLLTPLEWFNYRRMIVEDVEASPIKSVAELDARRLMRDHDDNGDGHLDRKELDAALKKRLYELTHPEHLEQRGDMHGGQHDEL